MNLTLGLSFLLLLSACGGRSSPVAPADPLAPSPRSLALQDCLTGRVAYLYAGTTTVWWVWESGTYEFGQQVDGQLVVWEKGGWWVQQISDLDFLVLDPQEGAQQVQTDTGKVWRYYTSARHRIPIALLGTSLQDPDLQLELDVGRIYTYHLAPLDSLEAIKAHRP